MQINSLGNCPATHISDPMAVNADSFRAYIDATVGAGFDAVSLWAFHLLFAGDDAVDVVRSSGLKVEAVEAAIGLTGGATDAATAEIDGLVATGAELGARIVGAAGVDSGADNATILLDTFHWSRQAGGPDLATLRSVPGDRVAYVQMCEPAAAAHDSVEEEAMIGRRPPGAGAIDYASIWDALDHIGADPFVAAEVFSSELAEGGPEAMAATVHDACRSVLPH